MSTESVESIKAQTSWRAAQEKDFGFVLDTYLKSFQRARAVKFIRPPIYFAGQMKVIDRLFKTADTLIVKGPGGDEQIAGYVIYQQTKGDGLVVHYTYVKKPLRRFGIATMVMDELVKMDKRLFHTHFTDDGNHLIKKYKSVYNPYLAGAIT